MVFVIFSLLFLIVTMALAGILDNFLNIKFANIHQSFFFEPLVSLNLCKGLWEIVCNNLYSLLYLIDNFTLWTSCNLRVKFRKASTTLPWRVIITILILLWVQWVFHAAKIRRWWFTSDFKRWRFSGSPITFPRGSFLAPRFNWFFHNF
jgi:hypothetical protein